MKRVIYILIIPVAFIIFYLANIIVPLTSEGIIVKYQRNTGPEFIVINEKTKFVNNENEGFHYSEFFIDNKEIVETNLGFLSSEKYIIDYEVIDYRKEGGFWYPVVSIKSILLYALYKLYVILLIVFNILLLVFIYLLVRKE